MKSIGATLVDLKKSSDARLSQVEDRLANLEGSVKETVRSEVENATAGIADSVKNELAKSIDGIVEARLKETDNRKNRAKSLDQQSLQLK